MSENLPRSLLRQYWAILLVALVTWVLHASVDRKFAKMMRGMQAATTMKRGMRMEELQLFNDFRDSALLHSASRKHLREAYAKEDEAAETLVRLRDEESYQGALREDVSELEAAATRDEESASQLDYASIADHLDYVSSSLKGNIIQKQAEEEARDARDRLADADKLEEQGLVLIQRAEQRLNETNKETEQEFETDQGICGWMPWVCKEIERNKKVDTVGQISNSSLALASELTDAFRAIEKAKEERYEAMDLLRKSSVDVNQSIAILNSANELNDKANKEHAEALQLHEKAKEEDEKADESEILEKSVEASVADDKSVLIQSLNSMSELAIEAREEFEQANALDFRRRQERADIRELELKVREMTFNAQKFVAHAGWYSLIAILVAAVLCYLCLVRIFNTFKTHRPLQWLLRNEMPEVRDISYAYLHILILILTLSFSGHLLLEYHTHKLIGKIQIIFLFSLVAAFFQVFMLHLLPNVGRLILSSHLNLSSFSTLLFENVVKSGVMVFVLFFFEFLLLWVNVGTPLFSRIYQVNSPWLWAFVAVAAVVHLFVLENYKEESDSANAQRGVMDANEISSSVLSQETEMKEFVDNADVGSTDLSLKSVDLSSISRCENTTYGSTIETQTTLSEEITSTFIPSMSTQLCRILLLFDFLLLSWGVWVVRYNICVIVKLSPLSPGVFWGRLPLWSLVVLLGLLGGAAIFAAFRSRQRKESDHSNFVPGSSPLSTTPLL